MKKKWSIAVLWIVTILTFAAVIAFFSKNNLGERDKLIRQIDTLEMQRDYYRSRIEQDSIVIERLRTDDAYLEQHARENYLMKREGDEVFVVE